MMEKVKITKEQEVAIKFLMEKDCPLDALIRNSMRMIWVNQNNEPNIECLNDLDVRTLVYAADGHYEVEPKYKLEEWVMWESVHERTILQIKSISYGPTYFTFNDEEYHSKCIKRHATPEEIKAEKERQLWKSIGREVGEFRVGDVIDLGSGLYRVTENMGCDYYSHFVDIKHIGKKYENNQVLGFYPAESFISFESEENK